MYRVEYFGYFHADGGQFVDVEESAIIDLIGGDTRIAQAIRLTGQELIDRVEASQIAAAAVVFHTVRSTAARTSRSIPATAPAAPWLPRSRGAAPASRPDRSDCAGAGAPAP